MICTEVTLDTFLNLLVFIVIYVTAFKRYGVWIFNLRICGSV